MYVCVLCTVYACMYVCMYVCVRVNGRSYVWAQVCMHVCMYVAVNMTHVHTYICIHMKYEDLDFEQSLQ